MAKSALTVGFKVDIGSMAGAMRALEGVKLGVRNRVIKAAIAKRAREASRTAKDRAQQGETSLLKKSLGVVYRSYYSGAVWVYVVGPRKDVVGVRTVVGQGGKLEKGTYKPYKIAHIAEKGRKALVPVKARAIAFPLLKGGPRANRKRKVARVVVVPRVREARGFFFMRKAYARLRAQKWLIERDIIAGVKQEWWKYWWKGKSIMA